MERFKKFAVAFAIALLAFPSTSSSQVQESPRTARPEPSQTSPAPPTKFFKSKKPIPNRYIVVLTDDVVRDDAPLEVRRAKVTAIANSHAQTYGGKVDYIYETALKGYAIELPNEAAAIAISNLAQVKWVEEDSMGEVDGGVVTPQPTPASPAVCRGKPVTVSLLDYGPKRYGRRMPFLNGGIPDRRRLVIRDREEFAKLWNEIPGLGSNKALLPEVDFSREMIVVAAMGQRPTSGYEIFVDSACEVDNQLEVLVRSTSLKCGGQLQVVTAPLDMVRLPKTDLPVVFRETEITCDRREPVRP